MISSQTERSRARYTSWTYAYVRTDNLYRPLIECSDRWRWLQNKKRRIELGLIGWTYFVTCMHGIPIIATFFCNSTNAPNMTTWRIYFWTRFCLAGIKIRTRTYEEKTARFSAGCSFAFDRVQAIAAANSQSQSCSRRRDETRASVRSRAFISIPSFYIFSGEKGGRPHELTIKFPPLFHRRSLNVT